MTYTYQQAFRWVFAASTLLSLVEIAVSEEIDLSMGIRRIDLSMGITKALPDPFEEANDISRPWPPRLPDMALGESLEACELDGM